MCAVEWKKLGDFVQVLRGRRLTKTELLEEGQYPVFHGGLEPLGYYNFSNREADSVMVINVGASAGTVGYCDNDFWSSDGCFTLSKNPLLLPKYIYCYLKQEERKISSKVRKAGIPTLDAKVIEEIFIPLIDVQRQQEIVSQLDTFSTLISNLESELGMRRKQYEHYRNQLLDFEGVQGVEWKTIEDIAEIGTGSSNTKDELDNGLYPFFVRSQQVRWQNKYEYDETAIITSGDGVGVGKIFHYIEGKYALHQRAYRIHILDTGVVAKYVYNYMKCKFYDYIMMNAYSSSVTSVRRPMLLNFEVPIPLPKTQQEIVSKLDTFEQLIQSLEQEIKLRKQQYEYYREKLLTFD